MSTASVVQYHKTLSPQKVNILQQNTTQNVQINLQSVKKQSPVSTLNPKDILLTNPARKKSKPTSSENGSPKLTNPAPVAVARRNARERNRVKQVNNGFATLRQHIPNSIASAFESSTGRGGSKKLSKVETLRMAVEYIRTLEDILNGDQSFTEISQNISSSLSSSISNSYNSLSSASTPSSSPINTTNNTLPTNTNTYTYPIMCPLDEDDDMTVINYNSTSKIYPLPLDNFYDNDNLDLEDNILSADQLIDGDLDLLNSMHTTTGSLSPELYSDDSLSPIAINRCRSTNNQMFIPVFNSTNEDIKLRITPEMIMEIKSEPQQEEEDSKENMVQVMQWWESQQQTRS
ncbi:uncharacterized protein [Atheta coriaria]|uniref:uncharacterized protein n=1 Tax=Dalotia coriaria TaxID=877792 RepID=UPI0031F3BD00